MPPSQVPQSPTNNDSGSTVVDRSPPVENYDEDCPLLSSTNSNNATTTVATHPSNAFNFFSVALLNRDKQRDHIRFHQLPDALEPIMTELIRIWGGRKHISKSSSKSIEYQLAYDAWSEFRTDTNAIWARSLLIEIMKRFAFHGWDFALGMEISKMMRGKDVLFFEKGIADTEVHIFCINFPKSDRIKVIGATPEVINGIGQVIQVTWPGGLQKGEFGAYKSFEFKVEGLPWNAARIPRERERKCVMMANILQFLRRQGYKSYASIKITQKDKEMPTLFFRKVTNIFK